MVKTLIVRTFDVLSRLGLGGMFVYAAWTKIQDPALFASSVASYDILPDDLVGLVALVLPMVELLSGIVLVFTRWSREAALIMLGMMLVFLVGLVQAAVRGLEISCGCFGADGEPDGTSLVWTIVRDVLLLIPIVWLVLRPKAWIWRRPSGVGILLALVCLAAPLAVRADAASAGTPPAEVAAERWTADFPAALERARAGHRPLLIMGGSRNCKLCKRVENVLDNKVLDVWVKDTGIYLVRFHFDDTNAVPAQAAAARFLMASPFIVRKGVPYVGVYWPKAAGDELRTAFTFSRNVDFGAHHASLMGSFVLKMNEVLSEYFATFPARPTLDEVLERAARQIAVTVEGPGSVRMSPADGRLKDGSTLKLTAAPAAGASLLGWRRPDGRMLKAGRNRTLTLADSAPEGVYTAVFGKR